MDRLTSKMPIGNGRLPVTTILSYIFDYAIIIILAIIYGALDKLVSPFAQRFSLTDITIQYPFSDHERVPIARALIISAGFPIIVILVYTLVIDGIFSHRKVPGRSVYTLKQRLWELNCGILGLLLAQGAAFCITGTLKNLVGRPRPDMISRCLPQEGAQDHPVFGLTSKLICTQTNAAIMQDAFRSFPSGHSSSSFAGLFYLSLYLSGKLHLFDQRGEVWRTVVVIIPSTAAACIAASRIMDYRHHPFDVLFGSALGLLCGYGAYRQYFPPLSQTWKKGRAFPIRTWGISDRRPYEKYEYSGATETDQRPGVVVMTDEMDAEDTSYMPPRRYQHQTPNVHHDQQTYALEPMRQGRTNLVQNDHVSTGIQSIADDSPSLHDDTEYEHIAPKGVSSPARQGQSHSENQGGAVGGANSFREQIAINTARRTRTTETESEDEMDLSGRRGYTAPRP